MRNLRVYPISHIGTRQVRFIGDSLLSLFKGTQK